MKGMLLSKHMTKFGRISQTAVNELILKANNGDINARNRIIEHNLPLITRYALNCTTNHAVAGAEDLFQQGVFGLMDAIRTFDISKGTKFSTWAVIWIKQKVSRYTAKHFRTINIPYHVSEKVARIKKRLEDGGEVEEAEKLMYLNHEDAVTNSIDKGIGEMGVGSRYDLIEGKQSENLNLIRYDIKVILNLTATKKRDKEIFMRKLDGLTLGEVGKEYKVSRERVRQIIVTMMMKIDRVMKKERV